MDMQKGKAFADNNTNVGKMMINTVYERVETLSKKDKMLVTSICSFSLNVFKSLLSEGH